MAYEKGQHPLNVAMAAEIRAERAAQGMTIEELYTAIGVSKSKMLNMLKPVVDIDLPDIGAIAEAFGIEPIELMTRASARAKASN